MLISHLFRQGYRELAYKLAGQRARFTRALTEYNSTEDEAKRQGAVRKMREVLTEAPQNGFMEAAATTGSEIPSEVHRLTQEGEFGESSPPEDPRPTDSTVRAQSRYIWFA
jgi:hypothetical protein